MIPRDKHDESECIEAKRREFEVWKDFKVFEEVRNIGQSYITSCWVLTEKDGGTIKAHLVYYGFQEDAKIQSDSPTCGKEAMRVFLSTTAIKGWNLNQRT